MNKEKVVKSYIKWMYSKISGSVSIKLLKVLHGIEFTWILAMDKNRAEDGIALRRRFIREAAYDDSVIDILNGPCSVLEMMVALALRMEEAIMRDDEEGDRTGKWFAIMCDNLGIIDNKDENDIRERVHKFLKREYLPNGNGNIFWVQRADQDFRYLEIWYQMHRFLKDYNDSET